MISAGAAPTISKIETHKTATLKTENLVVDIYFVLLAVVFGDSSYLVSNVYFRILAGFAYAVACGVD